MSGFAQHTMTNLQPQPIDLRRILLAVVSAVSIGFTAALFSTAPHVGGADSSTSVVGIDSAGAHDARVLEPGSRGSVVEI